MYHNKFFLRERDEGREKIVKSVIDRIKFL